MTNLVPDHQLFAIERWKAALKMASTVGALLCFGGWFNVTYHDWSFGWLATAYLIVGPVLVTSRFWLLHRGAKLTLQDGVKDTGYEQPLTRS